MEIIICLIFLLIIYKNKMVNKVLEIEDLPIGKNKKGYFDEKAFTEIYYVLKEGKDK